MTEREIPTSNVSRLPGSDMDVAGLEERLERLLVATIDTDATWSLVRAGIGPHPGVAPIRRPRRPHRALVLGVAAALALSGVAFAAVANRSRPSKPPTTSGGEAPHEAPGATTHLETGLKPPSPAPASDQSGAGELSTATPAPSPEATATPPSEGTTDGQQPGQDQQGDQGDQSPDPTSGQDQQGQSDAGDGTSVQPDASALSTDEDQGSLSSSAVASDR